MNNITHPSYTAAQTRELDRLAIEQECIGSYELMKRAAAGVSVTSYNTGVPLVADVIVDAMLATDLLPHIRSLVND